MSGRKTLIWALILLVLATFYYGYDMGNPPRDASSSRPVLLPVNRQHVTEFTLLRTGGSIRAERRHQTWYLVEPVHARGDDRRWRELVRYVTELRPMRLIETHASSLAPFGLATPSLEVQLHTTSDAVPMTLTFGAPNAIGNGHYVQVHGNPAVYLVRAAAKDVLDITPDEVRDKNHLAFYP